MKWINDFVAAMSKAPTPVPRLCPLHVLVIFQFEEIWGTGIVLAGAGQYDGARTVFPDRNHGSRFHRNLAIAPEFKGGLIADVDKPFSLSSFCDVCWKRFSILADDEHLTSRLIVVVLRNSI